MIEIFYGRVTDAAAHIYVRVPRTGPDDTRTVSGWVRGPQCALSHTLPATITVQDRGPGPTLLGSATVPDPCFWSPRLPALYDVHVELREGSRVVQIFDQTTGIRRLGAAGRNLYWESKRWVLRGVGCGQAPPGGDSTDDLVAEFRAAAAAMLVADPAEPLCRSASQAGVVVVAQLTNPAAIKEQLGALARWGSVAIASLPAGVAVTAAELHAAAPNLLLAHDCDAKSAVTPPDWADLIVCRTSEDACFHAAVAACPLPIVAETGLNELKPVADARAACDDLQRDLAPGGDYAGYLVTQP